MTIRDIYRMINESYISGALDRTILDKLNHSGSIPSLLERIPLEEADVYLEGIRVLLDEIPDLKSTVWEHILERIDSDCLSDHLLKYFFEQKIALITLGHMELSDQWLWRFGKYVEEALFTLGKRLYTNRNYTVVEIVKLLSELKSDSLLQQLINCTPSTQSKRSVLIRACYEYGSDDTQRFCSSMIQSEKLFLSDNPNELSNAYHECRDSEVLLAISQNIFTPRTVLDALAQTKMVKRAQLIRQSARTTLEVQSAFSALNDKQR